MKGEIIGINEEDKIDIPDIYADHNIHNENKIDSNSEDDILVIMIMAIVTIMIMMTNYIHYLLHYSFIVYN